MNTAIKNNILPSILSILLFTYSSKAQQFKVIEDKPAYQLQLIDNTYFNTHGNNNNAPIDTSQKEILNSRAVMSLSIGNGQTVKFRSVTNPDLSDYVYAGIFKCCNLYLVHGKIKYLNSDNYYLINSVNGKIDTLTGYPVLSPSGSFYATNPRVEKNTMLEMTIKNLNTGVITTISCPDETETPAMVYKWENEPPYYLTGFLWQNRR